MNIRKEDCNEETMNRIADRSIPYIKEGTFTPEIAATIIEDEYVRQMILTGDNIIFPKETGEEQRGKKNKRKRRRK